MAMTIRFDKCHLTSKCLAWPSYIHRSYIPYEPFYKPYDNTPAQLMWPFQTPPVEMCAIYKYGNDDVLRVNAFSSLSFQFDAFCFHLI